MENIENSENIETKVEVKEIKESVKENLQNVTQNEKVAPKRAIPTKNRENKQSSKGFVWFKDLKKAFIENEKTQNQRMNPSQKIEKKEGWYKFTPLGGLDEIGGNCAVFETENDAIIIDCGMSFPTEDMHGVDILVPDFTYLREIKHKIRGLVITHGHEDHIGAVPYLFKEMQFPIYGTSLPLSMIENKFNEHKLAHHKSYFRAIKKRKQIKIGNDFIVEWMHMTHSIIDASSLAIQTPIGTIIHTADFKIDHTPIDGYTADLHRFAYYGEKGVLAMYSDSTNSYKTGITPSEATVGPTFDNIFMNSTKNRVIMSTFSSNIHRVYQAIQHGLKYNRKICIIGRSMEKNLDVAMNLGYIKIPSNVFIEPHEIGRYSDEEVLIITTGSQGESMSALYRMAIGEHRHVKLKENDQIIISARAIPGNEPTVSMLINQLLKKGAKVAYQDFSEIHVSGHAAQEEQKLLLRLVQPRYFFPVHGEYNHLLRHKKTALSLGFNERNIFLMQDGDTWEVGQRRVRKVKTVKTGKVFIDNFINKTIEDDVVIDRQKLANDGIVIIIAQIDAQEKKLITRPKVASFGLVSDREDRAFAKEMEDILENYLNHAKPFVFEKSKSFENELKNTIRKHIFRKMKKYPTIVPNIFFQ